MKQPKILFAGLLAGTAMAIVLGTATTAGAASTPLMGRIDIRPLSPSDIKDYTLGSAQGASGLATVAVGTPAYLDAQINIAIPASNIVSVAWSLTKPIGSSAVLTNSPLGTNVPLYMPSDRLVYQVANRTMLRPDRTGQYTVSATITTTSGTTNVTQKITAGTYMGVQTCEVCHSYVPKDIVDPWSKTLHASKFTRGINGLIPGYSKSCISCHVVGYDTNALAVNGGFDDVATYFNWSFPTVLTNGNFESMPSDPSTGLSLANLANIQCENCHGPGSEHAAAFGNTNISNWPRISVSTRTGNCGQCHDSKTHHINVPEWNASVHAIATTTPSGAGHDSCVRCHTGSGYADFMSNASTTNTAYGPITCAACHDPHDATNPHQLRTGTSVTLMDNKTVITSAKAGTGIVCMNCHMSRRDATNYVDTTAGGSQFGPHHGPQTDMFMGVNAITYGQNIPSSAHRDAITNACVTCHMQPTPASTDPAFLKAGGHTFGLSYTATNGATVDMVSACAQCHGPIGSFDIARQDFDGNGIIEGAQTEVKGLLNQLSFLLPPVGTVKTGVSLGAPAISFTSSWTKQQLRAGYNYMFVVEDRSFGVHNLAYTVGLLKASIADLTGDANKDGMPDWWQTQYFGSINDPRAAANACPAGDGVPNWLKYSLGLDPMTPGLSVPGGVVWANGSSITGSTNSVQIYTAAEVAFNTESGKSYQIQAVSSLGTGWQNIGGPIAGTGRSVSYVTPTRNNTQQFYRVITTP